MKSQSEGSSPSFLLLLGIFVFLAACFSVIGLLYYRAERQDTLSVYQSQLSAIADLKVKSITRWRREHLGDAARLTYDPVRARLVARSLSTPQDLAAKREIIHWLTSLRDYEGYASVMMLDTSGKVRIWIPGSDSVPGSAWLYRLPHVIQSRQIELMDLHKADSSDSVRFDVLTPLVVCEQGDSVVVGVMLFRIDPQDFLFPMVQNWPTLSKTAETLLIRQDGDSVVFLNELRHRKSTVLNLCFPMTEVTLPAVQAALGREGIFEGIDYRGAPVLAVLKRIPDSPWFLVAKTDTEEIESSMRQVGFAVWMTVVLLILLAGLAVGMLWRNARAVFYRKLYKAEVARQAAATQFEYLVKYANDIILLTDMEGTVLEANDQACSSYGYSREELLRLNLRDLRAAGHRVSSAEMMRQVESSDGKRYILSHVKRDGTLFPVEASSRIIRLDGSVFFQSIIRDISERTKAEEALEESEERYRSLFENMSEGFAYCKMIFENGVAVDWVYLAVNEAFESLTGLKNVVGKPVSEVIPGIRESDPALLDMYTGVALKGTPQKFEIFVEALKMWFSISVYCPEKEFFVAVFDVITERKRTEQALNESEERFRVAAESLSDVVYEWDLKNSLQWYGDIDGLLGYQPGEFPRTVDAWLDILHPEDRDRVWAAVERQLKGEAPYDVDYRVRGKKGDWRYWRSRGTAVRDTAGYPTRWIGSITDITERERAEKDARLKDDLLHMTSTMAKVGGWEFDTATMQGTWTDEVAIIHDLQPGLPTNVNLGVSFYTPESKVKIDDAIKEAMEDAKPYDLELEMISAKGHRKWVRTMGAPVTENGKVTKVSGIFQDISERKRIEEEIRNLNANLEERVRERTAQLVAANKELESFSYSVSHDLRAPLRSLDGFSQALLEDYEDKLDDKGRDYLHRVRRSTQHMGTLIDDMISLSRVTRQTMNVEETDLSRMAEEFAAELRKSDGNRRTTFEIAPALKAHCDGRLLRIVMENLMGNSWKFTAKHPEARIEFGMMPKEGRPVFFIRDDGAGFDMTYAGKLFGAFQRLHLTAEFPGTGIGLATVQRIINRHGGQVWGEGAVEKGATFYFTLG